MPKRAYTESEFDSEEYGFATKAIHVAQEPEKWDSRCVIPPIVLSSTFKQVSPGDYTFDYGRSGNPTRNTLEGCLASLEKAKHSLCFSSGLGATTVLSYLLAKDKHILLCGAFEFILSYNSTRRFQSFIYFSSISRSR
jgi:cystathionine gamma-lyase